MNYGKIATKSLCLIGLLTGMLMIAGCGGDKGLKKDPFFEKWKTMEDTSKGYSPVRKPRTLDIKDIISKSGPDKSEEKPSAVSKSLPTNKINLKMRQADVKAVLRSLALAAGLNILVKNEVKGEISVDFKSVPWDQVFKSILQTQGLAYAWEGGVVRVMSMEDLDRDVKRRTQEMSARLMEQQLTVVTPIEYGKAKDIRDNLQDLLAKDKDGKPVGSIKVDEHSNSLIISAIRNDLERMMSVIEKIDKPTSQILIKANIVEATKDTARNLGVQWGGMYAQRVGSENVYVTPGGSTDSSGKYTPTYGTTGIAGQGYGVNFPAASAAAMASAGGIGSLGLIIGTIGGNVLEVQLQALQKDGKVNILSSPSITTLDNQMAYTENGEKVPYVSTSTSGGVTTQDVKFEDAVLRLEITPHVIGEKNLKMAILVKKNEVDPTGRNVLGNPYIFKKETKTNLIVKDGETIVISGLTKQRLTDSESGIPWLKNVPGLGWLFKSLGKAESLEEVLIFITPTILPPQVAAADPPAATEKPLEKSLSQ
ncbi:MAG: type IV pilus secretin PilQ [Pseudomonadota bacterium]